MNVPYIPGKAAPPKLPLERFLPPIPEGMVRSWCVDNLKPDEWVLDPFGFNPLIPIEIASAGHPVLVTVNNPIHAFMLKVLASAPQKEELIGALQDLAVASKGDDRMEPYIRSLYSITCVDCRHQVEANGFVWQKDAKLPHIAIIDCPHCGSKGEQKLNDEALNSITPLPSKQLHQARALNRIVTRDDTLRPQVENALNAYPTRPLIVLQTMINKLEGLEQSPRRRDLLIALILSAADQGNTLWAYPTPRNRPRQIVIPSVFMEKNLWQAMEEAIETWQILKTPIPVADWKGPNAKSHGIYIFKGRIKELVPKPEINLFSAVLTAIPRPNQAFWTLSALWTGWIWGQDAVTPIRQVLSRQRYDWNWHSNALSGVFDAMHSTSHPSLKIWGLIAENEPMFLLAALLAANSSQFKLTGFAQSLDDQLAQCQWEKSARSTITTKPVAATEIANNKIANYLRQKGEPATYQQVHAAAVTGLSQENKLAVEIFLENLNQATSETQKWIETSFNEGSLLTRVTDESSSIEVGEWWLTDSTGAKTPLIDRVEEIIIRYLIEYQTITADAVKKVVYQAMPGIFTPEDTALLNCLESYAELVDLENRQWTLRESEMPAVRRADINAIKENLNHIAQRLGYTVSGEDTILWHDNSAIIPRYSFQVFSSAMISKHLQQGSEIAQTNIFILPGSRANLLAYKRQRDPVLKDTLDRNFLIVKFSLIRDLEVNPLLSRDLFKEQIHADPPEYQSSQLALF